MERPVVNDANDAHGRLLSVRTEKVKATDASGRFDDESL